MFVSTSLHALLVPRLFTVRLDGQSPQPVLQPFLRNMRYVVSWNWHPDSKRVSLYVRTSSLSYDGSRLAYVADRAGTAKMEFWMTDLTGGNHRQLTDDDHARFTPQWSRDGRTLAYGWSERPGTGKSRQALAIRSMDSQEEQLISTPQLVAGWAAAPYDWSLDGRSILASSVVPHPPVHSLTLWPLAAAPRAETALTTLAYDPHYDLWQARYSPDGKWICFVASEREITGGNTIFVMPSSGGERSQWTSLTDSREWADKPRWSPDGTLVYFIRSSVDE